MRIRKIALALLLCFCLAACGGEEDGGGQPSLLETASGLEETAVLLTVDGREVPAWRYLYWLAYACDRIAERYMESQLPLDWSTAVPEGTLAESAKEQALSDTVLYATVENWAETYHCTPAESAGGETAILPDLGLSAEQMEELETVGRLYAALCQLCRTEDSALAPTDEELQAFGQEAGAMTLDRILVKAEGDREDARQQAEVLFSQLNGAEDQAAEFSALAAAGDDAAGPRTLFPGEGGLDAALEEAGAALEEGQISGILESEEGFSILRRLPLDTKALTERCFDRQLETAAAAASVTVTSVYETLDPAAFYNALRQARQQSGET